jgi:citrate synthase
VTVQEKTIVPGLAGIPAAESSVSYIDGNKGILEYRGYPIMDLAEHSTFEEVSWLLLYGELPTAEELEGFKQRLRAARELPGRLYDVVKSLPGAGHPMDALQASTAALGMFSKDRDYNDPKYADEACIRLIAATPVLIAAFERQRSGKDFVEADPEADTAAAFLQMLTGQKPDDFAARVLDVALILHADHTMNASTFTARVVASTEADPYTVCCSALGSLAGPLHGGANERVLDSLKSIGGPESVPSWLEGQMTAGSKVMGFGHRVYKVKDPRSLVLQGLCRELFERLGSTPIYDTALALEEAVVEKIGHKGIYPNVDFFSGIVYSKLAIPIDVFTPVFAIARVSGWLAHWREQMTDNKIYRPGQVYTGTHEREYVPMDKRG